jgi:DNA-binding NarL/FixJ family response regulator
MRIAVADDSMLTREGVVHLLTDQGHEVVGQAGNADDLISIVTVSRPDAVVVDIRMPPTHTDEGLRAAATIRATRPGIAIMLLSAYVADAYVGELLDSTPGGGIGYLLKDRVGHVRDFLDSIDRVAAGGTVVDAEVVRQLVGLRRADGPLTSLTEREREVLALMAEGHTNNAIASKLFVSEAAVRKHIGNIFAKLPLDPHSDRRVSAVLTYLRGSPGA